MKHVECINYINLDCEKGMCALSKQIVPIDSNGSDACGHFQAADKHGIGTCKGFEKENWTYAKCGAFCCEHYKAARG